MRRSTRWFVAILATCLMACLGLALVAALSSEQPILQRAEVLRIHLAGQFPEQDPNAALNDLLGRDVVTLRDLIGAIDHAATDDGICALELRIGDLAGGWATAEEIRAAIARFSESGKPVQAFLEGGDDLTYFLASAAGSIWMIETGTLWLDGLSAEVSFYGGSLDKLGVVADLEQIGEYKNAADVMKRQDMTESHRESMNSLLDGLYGELIDTLAESLDRPGSEVEELISAGPYSARQALESGLIDALGFDDEARDALDEQLGHAPQRITLDRYASQLALPHGSRVIAVIPCEGTIVTGTSSESLLGGSSVGSDTIAKALRDARRLPGIAGVVLRVNSPGGSPVASDVIWRETVRTRQAGLPVVVSMGDVAASGGYWISMGADKVLAQPSTITGSIGIYGGKYVTRGLEQKVAMNTVPMQRGANAAINSGEAPFTDAQRQWLRGELAGVYQLFIERTAEGRGFTSPDEVDAIGRGRVWTGRQAKERGLVDELGGLDDAIDVAADLASVQPDELGITWLPRQPSILEMFVDQGPAALVARAAALSARHEVVAGLPERMKALLPDAAALSCLEREGMVTLMPFRIRAR